MTYFIKKASHAPGSKRGQTNISKNKYRMRTLLPALSPE